MSELSELEQQEFSDRLVQAAFQREMEPFLADDVIERTFSALKELSLSAEDRCHTARNNGDEDLYRRASSFRRAMQRTLGVHKPRLADYRKRTSGASAPGSTNWRKMGMEAIDLIRDAVDADVVQDDDIHDRMITLLEQWESGQFRVRAGS